MVQELSISEARKKLPALLKAIQKDSSLSFLIKVREEPIAALRALVKGPKKGRAVQSLLRLMKKQERVKKIRRSNITSENFKNFLYGK